MLHDRDDPAFSHSYFRAGIFAPILSLGAGLMQSSAVSAAQKYAPWHDGHRQAKCKLVTKEMQVNTGYIYAITSSKAA